MSVDNEDQIAFIVVIVVLITLVYAIRKYLEYKKRLFQATLQQRHHTSPSSANQQEDVYNISARVQGQGAWPTHEGHVSLDHFAITNETNKYGDAPPSYEEAVRFAPPVLEANPSSLISATTVPKPVATHQASTH